LRFGPFSVAAIWNIKIDFKPLEPLSKGIAVIAFVGNQSQQAFFEIAATVWGHFYRFKGFSTSLNSGLDDEARVIPRVAVAASRTMCWNIDPAYLGSERRCEVPT
jgi:hypothetical protein